MGLFVNARAITPEKEIEHAYLRYEGDRITAVGPMEELPLRGPSEGEEVEDLAGLTVTPGFIDLHVNGGGGADFLSGSPIAFEQAAAFHMRHGVTALIATFISAPMTMLERALAAAREYQGKALEKRFPDLLGIYLEGPFISPRKAGAHPVHFIIPPSGQEFLRLQALSDDAVRIVTVAPEVPGALQFIKTVSEAGVLAALGHTDASYDEARAGIEAGIKLVTHAFNAMRGFHHREPGAIGAVLDDEALTLELIADGEHLAPATIRLLYRLKGCHRLIIVSDAVSAAGADVTPTQPLTLGGQPIRLVARRAVDSSATLAGSVIPLDGGLRNFLEMTGASLREGVQMVTANPAKLIGLYGKKGSLCPGADADLVILDRSLKVRRVYVRGTLSYWGG